MQLWREVANFEDFKRLETAYVVKLHNFVQLAEEKPCFTFRHPNSDVTSETNNKRHAEVHFNVAQASIDLCCLSPLTVEPYAYAMAEWQITFKSYIPL